MYRRLYCSFPTTTQARRAVAGLRGAGAPTDHLHAVAEDGADLTGLPSATEG